MARKSRYTENTRETVVTWSAAVYIRLSREDGDKEESDSITNQRALLADFIEKLPELTIYDYYVDDGYTGTSFDRPAFTRMMADIKNKRVNCVVVKDLSRFGRNYIEAGNYIEQIFPFLDVRFIAVVDMLDSVKNPAQMNTLMLPFKNLINDEYSRDISNKIRSSLDMKRRRGQFIGAFASFGYQKDAVNKNRLVVDAEAAEIVRDIFRLFSGGTSIIGIAKRLNELGVPNPSAYKQRQGCNYKSPGTADGTLWQDSSVRRILSNRIYTGDMVQGKNKIKSYKVNRSVSVPREDWIVVENTHEAIIDRATFDAVQELLTRDVRVASGQSRLYPLSGFVRCADCGKAMNRKNITQPYAEYGYYVCSTYKKMSKDACTKHTIRSDRLEKLVLTAINKQIELAVSMDELIAQINASGKSARQSGRLSAAIASNEAELDSIKNYVRSLYEDWKNGDITRDEYHAMKSEYSNRSEFLQNSIARLCAEQDALILNGAADNPFVAGCKKHKNIDRLTRELVVELLEMVYIHEGGNVTIQFKFEDEFKKAVEFIENNREILTQAQSA